VDPSGVVRRLEPDDDRLPVGGGHHRGIVGRRERRARPRGAVEPRRRRRHEFVGAEVGPTDPRAGVLLDGGESLADGRLDLLARARPENRLEDVADEAVEPTGEALEFLALALGPEFG
jgi:hypothetical protein